MSRQININPPDNNSVHQLKVLDLESQPVFPECHRNQLDIILPRILGIHIVYLTHVVEYSSSTRILWSCYGTFWHFCIIRYFTFIVMDWLVLLMQLGLWCPPSDVLGTSCARNYLDKGWGCLYFCCWDPRWMGNIEYKLDLIWQISEWPPSPVS